MNKIKALICAIKGHDLRGAMPSERPVLFICKRCEKKISEGE